MVFQRRKKPKPQGRVRERERILRAQGTEKNRAGRRGREREKTN